MIKRPLNERFSGAVREGRKITTIRDKPWPVGKPIMLYNWSGKAYASPQRDVAEIVVEKTMPISIERSTDGRRVEFWISRENLNSLALPCDRPLWQCEGFDREADMQAWFSAKMKPGQVIERHLMRFRLVKASTGTN